MAASKYILQWINIKYITIILIYLLIGLQTVIRQCFIFSLTTTGNGESGKFTVRFDGILLRGISKFQIDIIRSIFYIGLASANFVGGLFSDLYGGKYFAFVGIWISSLVTIVYPIIILYAPWYILAMTQFGLGFCEGFTLPASYSILARWIPDKDMTIVAGCIDACYFFGRLLTIYVVYYIPHLERNYWKQFFRFWGGCGVILSWISLVFLYSSPWECKMARTREKIDMEFVGPKRPKRINWKKIIQDEAVWATTLLHIGHKWLFLVLIGEAQKIQSDIGFKNFPWYLSIIWWITTINIGISCVIVNRFVNSRKVPRVYLRAISIMLGDFLAGIPVVLMRHIDMGALGTNVFRASAFFLNAIHSAGGHVNVLDLTRYYAATIIGVQNALAGVIGYIILILIITLSDMDSNIQGWSEMYDVAFSVCVVTTLLYLIWARAERADWDVVLEDEEDEDDEYLD